MGFQHWVAPEPSALRRLLCHPLPIPFSFCCILPNGLASSSMVYAEANSTSLDMIQGPGKSFKSLVGGKNYTYSTQHTGYHLYGVNEHGSHFEATEVLPIMQPGSKNSVLTLSTQLNAFGLHIFLTLNAKNQVNRCTTESQLRNQGIWQEHWLFLGPFGVGTETNTRNIRSQSRGQMGEGRGRVSSTHKANTFMFKVWIEEKNINKHPTK